ncbi:MAG: hypothetical protein KOO62_11170, partial [candidate division Zixibacteria bacterium]|nr:hypothetical protein [candidate division Zixibacteria bacterium]
MSLRINHNLAALNAHRNLVNTTAALSKSMQKLSSGFRINQGADNPAGLVISEQFRAQIAGLNRAIENSEGSISMIQTAEGALNEVNNLLISMRELAIHAANEGFNDADQLAADQAEIENAIATIDRIAANTQFGTKKLLDGSRENTATITSTNTSDLSVLQSGLSTGTHSITATKTADASSTLNTIATGLSLANTDGDPSNLTAGVHNIQVIQASDTAKTTSDAFLINDPFAETNAFVVGAAAVGQVDSDANLAAAVAGDVGTYNVTLQYWNATTGNTAEHAISFDVALNDVGTQVAAAINTEIAAISELAGKITAVGGATGNLLNITTVDNGAQNAVRVSGFVDNPGNGYFNFTTGSNRGTSNGDLSITATTAANSSGTTATVAVADGTYATLSSLVDAINVGIDNQATFNDVDGASTDNDLVASIFDSNKIQITTRDEGSTYSIQMAAMGVDAGDLEFALGMGVESVANSGTDARVSFDEYVNSINDVKYDGTSTVTIENAVAGEANRGTVSMIVATGATTGVDLGGA